MIDPRLLNDPNAQIDEATLRAMLEQEAISGLKDLYYFDKYILGYKDMAETVHKPLCDFMYQGKDSKLIMMPRGSFKSSVITVGFSLHNIVLNPDIRILIASEKLSNAQKFLGEIKGHIEGNELFRTCYGKLEGKEDTWNTTEIVVSSRKKNLKEPTISTAGIDVTKVGMHYDLIIVDDPVSSSNVTSRDQIEKTLDWYKLLLSLLEPGGRLVVIGTRWDYGDLYGSLQEEPYAEEFDFYIKKAEWTNEKTGERELLFPERLTKEFLDKQKRVQGTYIYSCQYLNDPVPTEDATFRPEWFRYWIDAEMRNKELLYFMTVDPAISPELGADFTVFIIGGVDEENNLYIIMIDRGKYSPKEIVDRVFKYQKLYNTTNIGIETVGFQKTLKYSISDMMREQNHFFNITELKHDSTKSKDARIRALQPRYEQKTIYHAKGDPMTTELEHELLHFPKSKHDDIMDAEASLLEILYTPKRQGQKTKKRKKLNKITGW